jgi:hypothetical protein
LRVALSNIKPCQSGQPTLLAAADEKNYITAKNLRQQKTSAGRTGF